MDMQVQPKSTYGLYETPLLHQTTFWSAVKSEQGIPSQAYDIKVCPTDVGFSNRCAYLLDDVLLLFQSIGADTTIAYVPYGPAFAPSDEFIGPFLEELSESLRPHIPNNCIMLRYDLPWESPWAHEENNYEPDGQWIGPPEPNLQELRLNWGTQTHNLRKATTDILPSNTMLVNLMPDEATILQSMKPKTRYNIRLAQRHGVTVRTGNFDDLDIFYDLYRQTCQRNRITLHGRSFFEVMFNTHAIAQDSLDESTDFELLMAYEDDFPLAALFIVYSSLRATYLFGASSTTRRDRMGTYALQWEAIRRAKKRGCFEYDLFGTPPNGDPSHPMHGLYRFKNGFGGNQLHRMGCWDYPMVQPDYTDFVNQEMLAKGYHLR